LIEKKYTSKERKADYAPDAGIKSKKTQDLLIVMIVANITEIITEKYLTKSKKYADRDMQPEKQKIFVPGAE
jgi:hypothetical protein